MGKLGFDPGPFVLEARVSVWDPWCGESGFRSGPLSLGSPGFGLGSLVGKDGCRPVALGVEKFGFGPCLWCEKFGCDTWSGNSGIASGARFCSKPKQIFYLRWQLQSPPGFEALSFAPPVRAGQPCQRRRSCRRRPMCLAKTCRQQRLHGITK